MATCNNVQLIFDSECVGESLNKINTNFKNLDTGLCTTSQNLDSLDAYVKALSAKDSSTVDLTFLADLTRPFLSADVINNSLGTAKLGQDIPDTTKAFLTGASISSLIDVNFSTLQPDQVIAWSGSKWVNKTLVDEAGAKILDDLEDVTITSSPVNGQVLKYSGGKWLNLPEDKELRLRDRDYKDIKVTGNGLLWDINPGVVGTTELANDAVITAKIGNLQVTNDKIANGTITAAKLAFAPGQTNSGKNIGTGVNICNEVNDGTKIPFKTLRQEGAVTIIDGSDTITIRVPNASEPVGASGTNLGTGEGKIYSTSKSTNGNLQFKTLKAGTGISISETDTEVTISSVYNLGLSIVGVNNTGSALTTTDVAARIGSVYPPSQFTSGSICRVEVTVPDVTPIQTVTVTVPFGVEYSWNGSTKTNIGNQFLLREPEVLFNPLTKVYTGSKTYEGTATLSNLPVFRVPTRQIWTYTLQGGSWSFTSQS